MFISEVSYWKGETKNVNLVSVQLAHRPVQACKVPGFMQDRIRPRMETYTNSDLVIGMVLCLHQGNVRIKQKLHCMGKTSLTMYTSADSPQTCTGLQTSLPLRTCKLSRFIEGSIEPRMEICVNSGLPIAIVP